MEKEEKIYLFDTTLRDGQQTTGVNFSVSDKMIIANALDELGIDYTHFGAEDKLKGCRVLMEKMGIEPECIAYVGDDVNDIQPARKAGWSYAVANASHELKLQVNQILKKSGGSGIFAEIRDDIIEHYSNFIDD